MRSPNEILFRLKQETTNLYLLAAQPQLKSADMGLLPFPNAQKTADALRETGFADRTLARAELVLAHNMPLLGTRVNTGSEIQWRFDYQHERGSDLSYFRRIRYLDFAAVGDHKFIWELNRHQHLVLLAQAYCLRKDERYLSEILAQLESWRVQNPFQRGINWSSALEVAFRALSWVWVYHLVGSHFPENARHALRSGLYQHALHLAANLSVYFSPNTHLLGEAVVLFTIAKCFPTMPGAGKWEQESRAIVEEQLRFQVRDDGSHFEQSTYYHVYALDLFLWFYLIAGRPEVFRKTLGKMGEYLHWLLGKSRRIWFFGDDDGGRLFYPYGRRSEFGRATLATAGLLLGRQEWLGDEDDMAEQAAWWIGPEALVNATSVREIPSGCRFFPDSGAVFLQDAENYLQFDGGSFGYGGAGHSHSDTLSFCLNHRGSDILVDPGTFTYISDVHARNWFRGSRAHNTVAIDGRDQASAVTPFRWDGKPKVEVSRWSASSNGGWVKAVCSYDGYRHRRGVMLDGNDIFVLDQMDGPDGEHSCEQSWHWGASGRESLVVSSTEPAVMEESKISPAYGAKTATEATVVRTTGRFPKTIGTVLRATETEVDSAELVHRFDQLPKS